MLKKYTITTEFIEKVKNKFNKGKKLTRKENIFYQGLNNTLKNGYSFVYTNNELKEYTKCANDLFYFIEKYLNIKLKSYQKDWINFYKENRFLLFHISRQLGYSRIMCAIYLWEMLFNIDKRICLIHTVLIDACEYIDIIKNYYKQIPYFLKCGITKWNKKNIAFENGSIIRIKSNYSELGSNYDIINAIDIQNGSAHNNIINFYKTIVPVLCAHKNSRLILKCNYTKNNKEYNKFFYNLIDGANRKENDPNKNNYTLIKNYWWENDYILNNVNEIKKLIGPEDFDLEYNCKMII